MIIICQHRYMNTVEPTLLTETLVGGQLYLPPPSQNPVFLNSRKNSILLHSRKPGAPHVNFRKISVRETIWDLEFSEHLL